MPTLIFYTKVHRIHQGQRVYSLALGAFYARGSTNAGTVLAAGAYGTSQSCGAEVLSGRALFARVGRAHCTESAGTASHTSRKCNLIGILASGALDA